jgi:hypothetical protein
MHGYFGNEHTHPRLGRPLAAVAAAATTPTFRAHAAGSIRRFAQALLATLVSTLIVIADRMVDAWTNGGLLLALVVLWLAVFLGLVLFSRVSGRLAVWAVVAWRELSRNKDAPVPVAREG